MLPLNIDLPWNDKRFSPQYAKDVAPRSIAVLILTELATKYVVVDSLLSPEDFMESVNSFIQVSVQ